MKRCASLSPLNNGRRWLLHRRAHSNNSLRKNDPPKPPPSNWIRAFPPANWRKRKLIAPSGATPPPRRKRELGAEALGAVAFAILVPLDVALYSLDFFSFRLRQGWEGAALAAFCLGLYAWPRRWLKSPNYSRVRISWWVLSFVVALPLLNQAIETRHPYLNPLNPDHNRLAAERVLALRDNILAGSHADWVLRYARQVDEQGELLQAIRLYRQALRLDPGNRRAYARLASLEVQTSGAPPANAAVSAIQPSEPYWTADRPVTRSPRRRIDLQLENVEGCTLIIVPVGEVSDGVLDAVGHVVRNELDVPVYVSPDPVPLPPHTRVRGLATGPQWDLDSLIQAFTNAAVVFPQAPVKYLLITPVDIYNGEANYVFSGSSEWGAVMSSARFGGPDVAESLVRQRTAKQALGALLKSFKIPPSPDRNCVTSYTSSLQEFDAKGMHANAETLKLFRQAVADLNRSWQEHKTRRPLSR